MGNKGGLSYKAKSFTSNDYLYNGYQVTLLEFKEKIHVSTDYELGKDEDPVFPAILNWLKKY